MTEDAPPIGRLGGAYKAGRGGIAAQVPERGSHLAAGTKHLALHPISQPGRDAPSPWHSHRYHGGCKAFPSQADGEVVGSACWGEACPCRSSHGVVFQRGSWSKSVFASDIREGLSPWGGGLAPAPLQGAAPSSPTPSSSSLLHFK